MAKTAEEKILEDIQKFSGENCKLYNEKGEFLTKGQLKIQVPFQITLENYQMFSPIKKVEKKITITIKNMKKDIPDGIFNLHSILKEKNSFLEVKLKNIELIQENDTLVQAVDIFRPTFNTVNELDYETFNKTFKVLDWTRIEIPHGVKGKDTATQADAFESMCQEIVQKLGAKNLGAIGKGTDRGRDGTFLIDANSWIPITTNYSNSWILQCKYSKNYSNLSETDVYKEIVKVLMHKPDYFLIMTNRKVTSDFNDWLKSINEIEYHIPFKVVIIGREGLEEILSMPTMESIRDKYFTS